MTADLLSSLQEPPSASLAERLRPKAIDEVIGQQHLLGRGKPLRAAFRAGRLRSMILWGPPVVGKITLARLMADDAVERAVQIFGLPHCSVGANHA